MTRQCYQHVLATKTDKVGVNWDTVGSNCVLQQTTHFLVIEILSAFKDKESHYIVSESPFRL